MRDLRQRRHRLVVAVAVAGVTSTNVAVGFPESDYSTVTRLIILGGMLLLRAGAAAGERTRFPWAVAGGVVVVVPLLIGLVATVGSAIAQRVRPVGMSTLATD